MSRTIRTALCGLLATATVAGAMLMPAAASAAGAYIGRSAWLTAPAPAHNPTACTQRSIDLAAGVYRWTLHIRYWAHPEATQQRSGEIRLNAGRYTWSDCLDPFGPPIGPGWDYNHVSTLIPPAGARATLSYVMGAGWGNGTYFFGSGLMWLRP